MTLPSPCPCIGFARFILLFFDFAPLLHLEGECFFVFCMTVFMGVECDLTCPLVKGKGRAMEDEGAIRYDGNHITLKRSSAGGA